MNIYPYLYKVVLLPKVRKVEYYTVVCGAFVRHEELKNPKTPLDLDLNNR